MASSGHAPGRRGGGSRRPAIVARAADAPLSVEETRAILARHPLPRVREDARIETAAGMVLAAAVRAERDLPPFDRAALDGYAIRLDGEWREGAVFTILGRVHAGQRFPGRLQPGTAVQVMTGAPVPPGADGVVMVERSTLVDSGRVRLTGPFLTKPARSSGEPAGELPAGGASTGSASKGTVVGKSPRRPGIADRGEDARRGALLLQRGTLLRARHLAAAASAGRVTLPVFRLPRVGLVTTGSEIVAAGAAISAEQIRDSNGPMLRGLLAGTAEMLGSWRASDTLASLCARIERAARADVVVLTGGVSAGEKDLVPDALRQCGFRIHLHRVAMRPGRPFLFATRSSGRDRRAAFGLPGNPVSVHVTAWEFLLPYLRRVAGQEAPDPWTVTATSASAIRRQPGLTHFVLGNMLVQEDGSVQVTEAPSNGSGDLVSASRADCLILLPPDRPWIEPGEACQVHPLDARSGA